MSKRKHVNAIFTFSKNVSQFLTDAQTFYTAISTAPGSAYVTVTPAAITAAQAKITAARTAESAVGTGAMGLAAARDLAVGLVEADVRNFVMVVQAAANNALDVATATTIVTECGLNTRRISPKTKNDFEVVNDTVSAGVLDVVFKAADRGGRSCYETQMSTDNVNWTTVKISPDSRIAFSHGAASGTKLYFRGRVILSERNGGAQAWITPPSAYVLAA